jgi:hypothetical protein
LDLSFLYKFRLQQHALTINFAVNIMVVIDQADVFDLGAAFDYQ